MLCVNETLYQSGEHFHVRVCDVARPGVTSRDVVSQLSDCLPQRVRRRCRPVVAMLLSMNRLTEFSSWLLLAAVMNVSVPEVVRYLTPRRLLRHARDSLCLCAVWLLFRFVWIPLNQFLAFLHTGSYEPLDVNSCPGWLPCASLLLAVLCVAASVYYTQVVRQGAPRVVVTCRDANCRCCVKRGRKCATKEDSGRGGCSALKTFLVSLVDRLQWCHHTASVAMCSNRRISVIFGEITY